MGTPLALGNSGASAVTRVEPDVGRPVQAEVVQEPGARVIRVDPRRQFRSVANRTIAGVVVHMHSPPCLGRGTPQRLVAGHARPRHGLNHPVSERGVPGCCARRRCWNRAVPGGMVVEPQMDLKHARRCGRHLVPRKHPDLVCSERALVHPDLVHVTLERILAPIDHAANLPVAVADGGRV